MYDEEKRKPKVAKQVYVNLRRTKKVHVGKDASGVVTRDTIVDAYARREEFRKDIPDEQNDFFCDDCSLKDFVRQYGYSPDTGMLFLQEPDAIITIYPRSSL